ncbi:MAG: single-stranded DNA-binding protein [Deltaproteobacteria bacterium]|nr:single-stranded DNA-binding protein [Deltaproteobacteria bacterium]
MASMNKVILVGHLGADPELRYLDGGRAVCRLSLATNRVWTDAQGQKQEETDWHRVTVWGKSGERCGEYLRKGRRVCVEGRLHPHSYTDKQGAKRHATEVVSEHVPFLDRRGGEAGPEPFEERRPGARLEAREAAPERSDELPF